MKRIVVFGTFDIFHPGHRFFLEQAKKLGGFLLVVVARDQNVTMVKGQKPEKTEKARKMAIKASRIADKVIIGSKVRNYFRTLRTHQINLIALGYDQKPTVRELKKALRKHHLGKIEVKRLKSFRPKVYKSSLLKNLTKNAVKTKANL